MAAITAFVAAVTAAASFSVFAAVVAVAAAGGADGVATVGSVPDRWSRSWSSRAVEEGDGLLLLDALRSVGCATERFTGGDDSGKGGICLSSLRLLGIFINSSRTDPRGVLAPVSAVLQLSISKMTSSCTS